MSSEFCQDHMNKLYLRIIFSQCFSSLMHLLVTKKTPWLSLIPSSAVVLYCLVLLHHFDSFIILVSLTQNHRRRRYLKKHTKGIDPVIQHRFFFHFLIFVAGCYGNLTTLSVEKSYNSSAVYHMENLLQPRKGSKSSTHQWV